MHCGGSAHPACRRAGSPHCNEARGCGLHAARVPTGYCMDFLACFRPLSPFRLNTPNGSCGLLLRLCTGLTELQMVRTRGGSEADLEALRGLTHLRTMVGARALPCTACTLVTRPPHLQANVR